MENQNTIPQNDTIEETKEPLAQDELEYGADDGLTDEEYLSAQAFTDELLEEEGQKKVRQNWAKEIYEWISSIAFAVVLALIINQFFFSLVQVNGQSMEPTLYHNERLIVRKIAYTPEQKDIVIVKSETIQKFIVKRVIALPGQVVDFDENMNVVVDGVTLDEPYINEKQISYGHLYSYPLTVPKKGDVADFLFLLIESQLKAVNGTMTLEAKPDGTFEVRGSELVEDGIFINGETKYKQDCYFVLGDNRNYSSDSRTLGLIPESEIVGKSIFRLFPFSQLGITK